MVGGEQLGHETTEMIMRHYGKWIPDQSKKSGYQPINDWGQAWKEGVTEETGTAPAKI